MFAPMTALLNGLLMTSFIATKQVHLNTSNFLIMCVSLSDLLNGALAMPLLASFLYEINFKKSCDIFKPAQAANNFFATLSSILTLLIAIDRYLNMNPSLERSSRCAKVFQRPKIYYLVTFIAIGALIQSFIIIYAIEVDIESTKFACMIFLNFLMVTLGICAVAVLYTKAYIRVRNFTDASPIYKERNGNTTRPQYVRNLYRSVLILVLMMMLVYVPLCFAQMSVTVNILTGSKNVVVVHTFLHLAGILLHFNCIINSLVILWFNKAAKQWVLTKIRCIFLIRRKEKINVVGGAAIVGKDYVRPSVITLTNMKPTSTM